MTWGNGLLPSAPPTFRASWEAEPDSSSWGDGAGRGMGWDGVGRARSLRRAPGWMLHAVCVALFKEGSVRSGRVRGEEPQTRRPRRSGRGRAECGPSPGGAGARAACTREARGSKPGSRGAGVDRGREGRGYGRVGTVHTYSKPLVRARKQYTAVLALRCQSGGRETAMAAQGTDSQRPRDPKSGQAAARLSKSRSRM